MWARSIFTAFTLSVATTAAWAQTAPSAPGQTSGPTWRSPTFGADNGVVPATATAPAPLSSGARHSRLPLSLVPAGQRASIRFSLGRPP